MILTPLLKICSFSNPSIRSNMSHWVTYRLAYREFMWNFLVLNTGSSGQSFRPSLLVIKQVKDCSSSKQRCNVSRVVLEKVWECPGVYHQPLWEIGISWNKQIGGKNWLAISSHMLNVKRFISATMFHVCVLGSLLYMKPFIDC